MSSVESTIKCTSCGRKPKQSETTFRHCSACKTAYYCSTDCQRRDWKGDHKQQCKVNLLTKEAQAIAEQHKSDTVTSIRLACTKESGGFWEVDVPSDHSIFEKPLLEVPALLGIPLVIHRVGTQSNNRVDLDCPIATWLNIKSADGFAPMEWQSHVGTCLVARKDKKSPSQEHMDAVHMYISSLLDMFGDGPKYAQKGITRTAFEKWFEGYKREQVGNGHTNWEKVGSIFDA